MTLEEVKRFHTIQDDIDLKPTTLSLFSAFCFHTIQDDIDLKLF